MDTQSSLPYLAYKSKRHSRTVSLLSSQPNPPAPPASSPPSRPSSSIGFASKVNEPSVLDPKVSGEKPVNGLSNGVIHGPRPTLGVVPLHGINIEYTPPASTEPSSPTSPVSPITPQILPVAVPNGKSFPNGHNFESLPAPGSSSTPTATVELKPSSTTRKASTFRRVPLRDARASLPSSPLRSPHPNSSAPLSPLRQFHSPAPFSPVSRTNLQPPFGTPVSESRPLVEPVLSPNLPPPKPPPKNLIPSTSAPATPTPPLPRLPPTVTAPRPSTRFYRPGFQPKGVYRPRTEQFVEARKLKRNIGRIEKTRLERRLEKLINLHFSDTPEKLAQLSIRERRTSSFFEFDFSDLKNKSAGDLWKGVLQSQPPGGKGDIRAAEQKITPWEDDATVSQCPLCLASFHTITNRKHHCRLCGRIICSLPVKAPQRPVTCSLLFVADPKTGKIEEVGEGVDYGVRRRAVGQGQSTGKGKQPQDDDERFLKGVRICRECQHVLLRQQYIQEANSTPVFSKLYDHFVGIEKEIEDALPQFQELLLNLGSDELPTAEASAARKRLLQTFTQYDALAKRIRNLHCPGGPGGSQDRIQTAILTRANLFLQKNMFPLQSLPKPAKRSTSGSSTPSQAPLLETNIDPDSKLAHALQPLLEQEALLETFVQEAKSHRKFEDAQTLKANLVEIRAEIDRIVANADRGTGSDSKGKQRQTT